MTSKAWDILILAAGRGPDDPMAKAYGVSNKCLVSVAGVPMVRRVTDAVRALWPDKTPVVVTEAAAETEQILEGSARIVPPAKSAPGSVLQALASKHVALPLLITTGDHALLSADMLRFFSEQAEVSDSDFCVGLATAETILRSYPQSVRTFFRFGQDRVSGCNLFAVKSPRALALLEQWQTLEHVRKKPWRLVAAIGIAPLVSFALGRLSLADAFSHISRRLGLVAQPIFMPFAEAAIDVDKPADKDLAEQILSAPKLS